MSRPFPLRCQDFFLGVNVHVGLVRSSSSTSTSRADVSRLGWGETGRSRGAGFRSLDVAIARRGRRDERVEELPDCVRHLVHGTSERDFVGFGGSCETAELSDELQRRCPDFVVRGRWLEVVQRLDAATHRKSSSSTYRLLIGIAHSVSSLSAHSMSCTRIAGLAKEAFLPTRSSSRTPRALEHAPHTWIGVPSATVVRRASARGGQPTGTTAFATGSRIKDTASPRRKKSVRMQKRKRRLGRVVGTPRAFHQHLAHSRLTVERVVLRFH